MSTLGRQTSLWVSLTGHQHWKTLRARLPHWREVSPTLTSQIPNPPRPEAAWMTQPWFRAHLPIASYGWKVSKCLVRIRKAGKAPGVIKNYALSTWGWEAGVCMHPDDTEPDPGVVAEQVLLAFLKRAMALLSRKSKQLTEHPSPQNLGKQELPRFLPTKGRSLILLVLPSPTPRTHTSFICLQLPREAQHPPEANTSPLSPLRLCLGERWLALWDAVSISHFFALSLFSQTYLMIK